MPLAEIAKEIGFKSISSFSRKFTAIEGISPLKYRQQEICKVTNEKRQIIKIDERQKDKIKNLDINRSSSQFLFD